MFVEANRPVEILRVKRSSKVTKTGHSKQLIAPNGKLFLCLLWKELMKSSDAKVPFEIFF